MKTIFKGQAHKPFAQHRGEPREGDIEYAVLGECEECGWRCAVPGEGMQWPVCPVCTLNDLPPAQRRRVQDGLVAEPFPHQVMPKRRKWNEDEVKWPLAYLGLVVSEGQIAANKSEWRITVKGDLRDEAEREKEKS